MEKEIHTIKHLCFSEMEITWEMNFNFLIMQFCPYFTPSEASISKLEDKSNIPWFNTVAFYASNPTVINIWVDTVQPYMEGSPCIVNDVHGWILTVYLVIVLRCVHDILSSLCCFTGVEDGQTVLMSVGKKEILVTFRVGWPDNFFSFFS